MTDARTLSVYAEQAEDYRALTQRSGRDPDLDAFIAGLPPGARVLDLGCGPGRGAAHLAEAGCAVDAWDACPEMIELARRIPDIATRVASFDDLAADGVYDGIVANFSLLHAPRSDMPRHLAAIRRALLPGGLFHIGLKTGDGTRRDALGRRYAYYTEAEIGDLLAQAGFNVIRRSTGQDRGLDGTIAAWIVLHAEAVGG